VRRQVISPLFSCCILHNWILSMAPMKLFPLSPIGSPILVMGMRLLWMITQHGLLLEMNGLIRCGSIGVMLTSRCM
jgi:hypothetical protein